MEPKNSHSKDSFLLTVRKLLDRLLGFENLKNALKDEILTHLWRIHEIEMSRIEGIRNEILLEMRHGLNFVPTTETRIINRDKFNRLMALKELVLNIGSGNTSSENMINIDMRALPNVDIVADAAQIQLPKGCAKGIYSSHVLEHFPHEQLHRTVLPNWIELLSNGGFFRAVVPDSEGMLEAYVRGKMAFEDLRTVTFGLQEYEGDIHYTMFSRDSLRVLLEQAGLRDVTYVDTSRPNGLCLEMEVLAYK